MIHSFRMPYQLTEKYPDEMGGIRLVPKDWKTAETKIHKDWSISDDYKKIKREFKTNNHYELMSFINMVAWISNTEDHHPQITFSYNKT